MENSVAVAAASAGSLAAVNMPGGGASHLSLSLHSCQAQAQTGEQSGAKILLASAGGAVRAVSWRISRTPQSD